MLPKIISTQHVVSIDLLEKEEKVLRKRSISYTLGNSWGNLSKDGKKYLFGNLQWLCNLRRTTGKGIP